MAILSNLATESLVTATCRLSTRFLSRNKEEAHDLAKKVEMASQLAQVDPYRAATHNKGIFNGIDALVIATGNDWRAVEAGSHAFASKDGSYRGLSTWTYDQEAKELLEPLTSHAQSQPVAVLSDLTPVLLSPMTCLIIQMPKL